MTVESTDGRPGLFRRTGGAPAALAAAAALAATAAPLTGQEARRDTAGSRPDSAGLSAPGGDGPAYRVRDLRVAVTRREAELDKVPYSVSVVDAASAAEAERRTSLEEVLGDVPGVQASNRRNFSLGDRLVIRGVGSRAQFGVRGVKVLADGIPLTLPDGQTTLTNLDLGSARRLEVIRGPASSLYGNAAGGVVRVTSGGFSAADLEARPRLLAGADGMLSQELSSSGRVGEVDWMLHAAHLDREGFRQHSAAETWRANLVLRRGLGERGQLRAVLNLFHMPFGENPSSLGREDALTDPRRARPFIVAQGAGESATQGQAGVTLTLPLGPHATLRGTAWGMARSLRNPIPGRIIDLDRGAGGLRVEVGGEEAAGLPVAWTAGVDAELQVDDRRELENLGVGDTGGRARAGALLLEQQEEVRYAAPFLRVEVEPAAGLRLSAAGRLDAYRFAADDRLLGDGDDSGSRTLARFSPSLGAVWSPPAPLTLFANLATAFETPTTSELSNRPEGDGGFNPALGPQTTTSLEAGVRGRLAGPGLAFEVAGYRARVDEALVPFEGASGQVFFRNAGEILRRGLEVRLGWRPAPVLEASLSYAYQDFRFEEFATPEGDFSGNREPGVTPHRVDASLVHRLPSGLRARLRFTWSDTSPVDDANSASDWSHRVVDLRLSWEGSAGRWSLHPFLGIDNIFDERYNASVVPNAFGDRYYEPAPGRQVLGGVAVGLPSL